MIQLPACRIKRVKKITVCRIQKFNMKGEIERIEIIYTFYFFCLFEKSD